MSEDGRLFLTVLIGALSMIAIVIALWTAYEHDREEHEDAAANRRLRGELQRRDPR